MIEQHRIFSDCVENAEKRCNFSIFVDFNFIFIMIIPEIYAIVDWSFRFSFQFNFHRAAPPPQDLQHGLDLPVEVEELAVQHLRAEVDADLRREEERRLWPIKEEVLCLL